MKIKDYEGKDNIILVNRNNKYPENSDKKFEKGYSPEKNLNKDLREEIREEVIQAWEKEVEKREDITKLSEKQLNNLIGKMEKEISGKLIYTPHKLVFDYLKLRGHDIEEIYPKLESINNDRN